MKRKGTIPPLNRSWIKRHRILLIIIAALIVVRAAMPEMIRWYINGRINRKVDAYNFHIGDVDLWLIRGAMEIEEIEVTKVGGKAPIPFVFIEESDISIYWKQLFRGYFVSQVHTKHPTVNLVLSKKKEWQQTGNEVAWLDLARELAPIRVDRLEVTDAEVHLYNYDLMIEGDESEPADVYITEGYLLGQNLANTENLEKRMVATMEGHGKVLKHADLKFEMHHDPFAKIPTFDLDLELHDLDVTHLDRMMHTYAGLDFEKGTFSLALEVACDNGKITGYAKPVFRDLEVFRVKEDIKKDKDTGLKAFWESIAGTVAEIFKNQSKDQIATKIELKGEIKDPKTDLLGAVFGILQNAFISAFMPQIEHTVNLDK